MQVKTSYWALSATQTVAVLLAFGTVLGTGCVSEPSGPNRAPVERNTSADSAGTGIESVRVRERLSNLRGTVYLSVFISLFVSMIAAGLIWVLWRQSKKIRRLQSRAGSGLSKEAQKNLGNEIQSIRRRLKKLEGPHQAQSFQSRKGGRSSADTTPGFSRSSREREPEPEQESQNEDDDQDEQSTFTHDIRQQTHGPKNRGPKIGGDLEQDFNRVESGELSQEEFRDEYDPVRLSIENKEERLSSEEAQVLLHHDDRGQYLAVEKGAGYLVVPKFDVILRDTSRLQGGIDEAFSCGDVAHNYPYEVQRVEEAARFTKRPSGDFMLQEPGRIHLRRYD